jgi:hypothetical protein
VTADQGQIRTLTPNSVRFNGLIELKMIDQLVTLRYRNRRRAGTARRRPAIRTLSLRPLYATAGMPRADGYGSNVNEINTAWLDGAEVAVAMIEASAALRGKSWKRRMSSTTRSRSGPPGASWWKSPC